jgi:CubicO group peptidase (beta-lactamase class C family)
LPPDACASFTALTILKLRDDGELQLDALAGTYVLELRFFEISRTTDSASACVIG